MALYQQAVERYVEHAEKALPGLQARIDEEVDANARAALFELAALLALVAHPRILRPWRDRDVVVGVPLTRLKRDGALYTMILRTHSRAGTTADHPLLDGLGPPPDVHLDGFRFLSAFSGLLRILEAEVRGLIASEDFNWDEEWEDEMEHPEDTLKRVRAWRSDIRRRPIVDQVHAL